MRRAWCIAITARAELGDLGRAVIDDLQGLGLEQLRKRAVVTEELRGNELR
jgi:hypothetical protein